ncbi:hypothetical protein [Roseitalea porphyridii]|uniref:Uncharacterized protein n=1 Tax=Roseitalea porphyridii TaxID=1852022 RepID=A0A4V1A405_9HYPH|nr:hypothetical protein [Roseitalea porphyridii]QBK30938.1 hypothetical protein E0E05_10235 [Roseitalea porphyridii]
MNELDERLYEVFDTYAHWFNMIYEDSLFRIEERESADLNVGGGFDRPTYGPSFNLFYADKKFGEVGVSRDLLSDSNDAASLDCEIRNAVFLGFNDVHDILYTLHSTIARREEIEMRTSIDRAMQACVWNQIAFPDLSASVHLSVNGSYVTVAEVQSEMRSGE